MKKQVLTAILAGVLLCSSGCGVISDVTYKDDGVEITSVVYLSEEDGSQEELSKLKTKKINGKTYYYDENDSQLSEKKFIKYGDIIDEDKEGITCGELIQKGAFVYDFSEENEESGYCDFYEFNLKMAGDIVDTNGEIQKDGIVKFDTNKKETFYAFTKEGKDLISSDSEKPKLLGIKDGACYSSTLVGFESSLQVRFNDNVGVKAVYINGKQSKPVQTFVPAGEDKPYCDDFYDENGKSLLKEGENLIEVEDFNGNKTSATFIIDNKTPKIGLKGYKTYKKGKSFTVEDSGSGIASVTIGEKKIKVKKGAKKVKIKLPKKCKKTNIFSYKNGKTKVYNNMSKIKVEDVVGHQAYIYVKIK